ncbi:MAG: ABC transporter permease [Gammaproteobacteria bacterium]|nr:ABC transporter permease [Gammaproteobacteria bacterium]
MDSLYIAWKYISFYKARTATLVACVTLIAVLPLALELLLDESEQQLLSRADSTPLLLGTKGSSLDLVMNGLYFDDEVPELISMSAADAIDASGLATPIPLYIRFQARGFPIVGTSLDYFDFRGLRIAQGRQLALLGECVIGAEVAERLGLSPGDSLLSSPETLFDLAGVYPLKMKVVGVLARSYTPDDLAVLVDLKTAWVVQGLVHGHEDVTRTRDTSVVMKRDEGNVIANAKLVEYTEISPENINSFHFHGTPDDYPLTAVLALPDHERSGTILRGRYLDAESPYQLVVPGDVIDGLLANIFRIKNVLDAVILLVGIATALALILVFALSLRLRKREILTVFRIGGSRSTITRLLAAEIAIILLVSGLFCAVAIAVVDRYSNGLVRSLFIG